MRSVHYGFGLLRCLIFICVSSTELCTSPSDCFQLSDGSWVYWGKVPVFLFACWCGFTTTTIHMAGLVFRVDGSSQTGPVCREKSRFYVKMHFSSSALISCWDLRI